MNNVNYYYYPPTNHPFLHVTIIVVVGILYLEGREGKEGSIGIGYNRNENYCLKPSKLAAN